MCWPACNGTTSRGLSLHWLSNSLYQRCPGSQLFLLLSNCFNTFASTGGSLRPGASCQHMSDNRSQLGTPAQPALHSVIATMAELMTESAFLSWFSLRLNNIVQKEAVAGAQLPAALCPTSVGPVSASHNPFAASRTGGALQSKNK